MGHGCGRQLLEEGQHLIARAGPTDANMAERAVEPSRRSAADEAGDLMGVEFVGGVERQHRPDRGHAGHEGEHSLARRRVQQPDFSGDGGM